jgi:predicted NBD/HSP70 family sugar kinase
MSVYQSFKNGGVLNPPEWLRSVSNGGRSILDTLLKRGGASQASLSNLLELSQPSVARLVGGFHNDGLVRLSERPPVGRGNPSVQVTLNPDHAYSMGFGIVGDAISVALIDLSGAVRASGAVAMPSMRRDLVKSQAVALKHQAIKAAKIDPKRIVGAGVGFSGFFVGDPPRFNPPVQLEDWGEVDVAAELSEPLDMAVLCENDGTASAVAESLLGVGRECSNFAYCHLTNGFGGGIIVNGKPLRGALGNAGDFGGILWMLDEGYPSLENLREYVLRAGGTDTGVEDMVRRIDADSPGVSEWIEAAKVPIGKLAFLLGHILAPERVVIGGRLPMSVARELAKAIVIPSTPIRNNAPFPLPRIVPSQVEGDASALGAAAMPLQELFFVR